MFGFLLALVSLLVAVPSLGQPILGFLGTLVNALVRLLGVLVSAIAGVLSTLARAIAGLLGTLLNATASLFATAVSTLALLLPLIGVLTSLGLIAFLVWFYLHMKGFETRVGLISWAVCLLGAVFLLLGSIPGFLNSVVNEVGGIITALIALLGIVFAQGVQAYTAWRTPSWTAEIEAVKQEHTRQVEKETQARADRIEEHKQMV